MIRQTIFPKIKRMEIKKQYQITEKLDGSNLGIAKINDILYIFQRNTVLNYYNIHENKSMLYKGLYDWLVQYKDELLKVIPNNTIIFGEWLGMGKLKYDFEYSLYLFAKAKIYYKVDDFDNELEFYIEYLNFNVDKLSYAFADEIIPSFVGVVSKLENDFQKINKETMDSLYNEYTNDQNRIIEGFVIMDLEDESKVVKYVRCKNGKVQDHFQWEKNINEKLI